jgi:hypothetical protein
VAATFDPQLGEVRDSQAIGTIVAADELQAHTRECHEAGCHALGRACREQAALRVLPRGDDFAL